MDSSPSNQSLDEPAAIARRLSHFATALTGVLRHESIVHVLIEQVRETFAPSVVVALVSRGDAGESPETHTWPPEASCPDVVLAAVAGGQAGSIAVAGSVWHAAPLRGRGQVTGSIAIRDASGEAARIAPELLEAFAAQASVALESARLVDLHEDGRRSWQEIVDALSLALCIVDHDGRIRRANRAFSELVGAPPAAVVGHPWHAFTPAEWEPDITRLISGGGEADVELRLRDRTFGLSGIPIGEGSSSTTVLLFDDRTDRRQLQDRLLQSTKLSAMGQLIAGVAHELNNPLASVVGFADFLGEIPDVPPALREPLAVIREEAERASTIVKNLLGFARKQDRQRRPVALGPLLESTMALLRNALMAQRVEARVVVEPDLPPINLDANQMQQVFVNLVNNASQAIASTGQAGTVTIHAHRFLDEVAVDVIDDGPGMTEEVAAQVFDAFFTTRADQEGTGLGISISQGIVKEHGGRITLATEPGKGATFTVHLPVERDQQLPEPDAPPVAPARPLRVLVIDDEPHILHYMRATLGAWGHGVEVAQDGVEGLDLAASGEFDLVITDLRMPRLGGREFFEELCRRRPEMESRIYFSTGDTVRGDTLAFLEQSGRPFLHKPFSLSELRALLAAGAPR